MRLDRRAFLALAAVVPALGCRRRVSSRAQGVLDHDAWRVFDALTARILPSDDGPGAREAKVVRFLDRQLATKALRPIAPALVLLARHLDTHARALHRRAFDALPEGAQDAILLDLSRGALPIANYPQKEAFAALHTLTLEGFLSDPIHGGNDAMVGWRSIGFPTPPLRRPGEPHHHHP